jgi:hypothetical protein
MIKYPIDSAHLLTFRGTKGLGTNYWYVGFDVVGGFTGDD